MSSLLIVYIGCSKSAEEMCVEAQMNFYDQAKPKSNSVSILIRHLKVEMHIMLGHGTNALKIRRLSIK